MTTAMWEGFFSFFLFGLTSAADLSPFLLLASPTHLLIVSAIVSSVCTNSVEL